MGGAEAIFGAAKWIILGVIFFTVFIPLMAGNDILMMILFFAFILWLLKVVFGK